MKPTGEDVVNIILQMQAEAKRQHGTLTELALPEELHKRFMGYCIENNPEGFVINDGGVFLNETKIHTGEDD